MRGISALKTHRECVLLLDSPVGEIKAESVVLIDEVHEVFSAHSHVNHKGVGVHKDPLFRGKPISC